MDIIEFWQTYKLLGVFELNQIILFTVAVFVTIFSAKLFNVLFLKFIKKQAKKTKTELDDNILAAIEQPATNLIYIIGLYFALLTLNPVNEPIPLKSIITAVTETSVAIMITLLCFKIVDVFDQFIVDKYTNQKNKDSIILHFFPLLKRAIKVAIAFIALIIIIQNRGYSVASLLAGFGITGLAVGFAAKESIANIFGSFSVIVDHTYKVGDWIVADKTINGANVEGIVEDISLRSTKIRAFDNTLLIVPNNEMANGTIRNVSRHKKRRIYEFIDITYDTDADKIEQAVEICRQIVRNHPEMEEYQQIHFNKFGPHSLQIMLYIFTKTTDWGEYLRIRQEIFLSIVREFKKLGVEFAFPTQTLYFKSDESQSMQYNKKM